MANPVVQQIAAKATRAFKKGVIPAFKWGVIPASAGGGLFYGSYKLGDSIYGDPNIWEKAPDTPPSTRQDLLDHVDKSSMTDEQKKAKKDAINKKLNPDGSQNIPFYQGALNWIKQNPGWAAGIGAGVIGIPLVAWLMSRNNNQEQQQEYEDQNSYKYKYGRR